MLRNVFTEQSNSLKQQFTQHNLMKMMFSCISAATLSLSYFLQCIKERNYFIKLFIRRLVAFLLLTVNYYCVTVNRLTSSVYNSLDNVCVCVCVRSFKARDRK